MRIKPTGSGAGMKLKQGAFTALLGLSSLFFIAGCGDTFRPIANPLPKPAPDPKASGTAVVVFSGGPSSGGTAATGTSVQINVAGDSITGEVPLGGNPSYALIGASLISVNQGDNTVSVINTSDNSVTGPIAVGTTPVFGVASPDSTRVYILNKGSGTVSIIDTASDTVIAPPAGSTFTNATVQVGTAPSFAMYDLQLNAVYVTNETSNTLSVIDAVSTSPTVNKQIAEIALQGTTPKSVAVLPDRTKIYVANFGSGTVSVINALSNQVLKTISVGGQPISIAASLDNTKVVVANQAGYVSMISTATDTETMRITCPTSTPCAGQ